MNPEREQFLSLATKPARLTVEEAAWYLGFNPAEVALLIARGVLKPIGHPPRSGRKWLALAELERHRNDAAWLSKASDAIVKYHQRRNSRRTSADEMIAVGDIGP
jgi:hypothetical protein